MTDWVTDWLRDWLGVDDSLCNCLHGWMGFGWVLLLLGTWPVAEGGEEGMPGCVATQSSVLSIEKLNELWQRYQLQCGCNDLGWCSTINFSTQNLKEDSIIFVYSRIYRISIIYSTYLLKFKFLEVFDLASRIICYIYI